LEVWELVPSLWLFDLILLDSGNSDYVWLWESIGSLVAFLRMHEHELMNGGEGDGDGYGVNCLDMMDWTGLFSFVLFFFSFFSSLLFLQDTFSLLLTWV
jgi:hypothetical protein